MVTKWIMCDRLQQKMIDYDCQSRPWMTISLVVSVILLLIIRRQEYVVPEKQQVLDEEEELMGSF
ncbi:hypothetical protein BD770DRAFT_473554 [Pilaira anomala]|nr:hypothetical protein BD770DRAFT_473554 [Pilaira anomala]